MAVGSNIPHDTLFYVAQKPAQLFPNRVAQGFKADGKNFQTLNFREVYDRIRSVACGLIDIGMQSGDHAGLIADSGPRWLWCSFGIGTVGGVDVPRGTDATREDLLYIFEHADCPIIFLEHVKVFDKIKDVLAELPRLRCIVFLDPPPERPALDSIQVLTLDELMERGANRMRSEPDLYEQRARAVQPGDLASIIYTSGTTGAPKGVMLTHKNLAWQARSMVQLLESDGLAFNEGDVTIAFLPPWHIGDRMFETFVYYVGAAIYFSGIASLGADLKTVRPSVLFSVPRVWESFYSKMLENVRSASPLQQWLFHFARKRALRFSWHRANLGDRIYRLSPRPAWKGFLSRAASFLHVVAMWPTYLFSRAIFGKVRAIMGGRLRFAISGAGALPEHIDRLFGAIGLPIYEVYGMTETTALSTARLHSNYVIGTVGRPMQGVEIQLRDEQGAVVSEPGRKGVAWHRGQHIMRGYYKLPEKTGETLQNGWLNSGDIMVWTEQGDLKFAGRAKDTIVLMGGENLEPEPIEFALQQSPFIQQVMVVGQDRKNLGALIVPDFQALEAHLKSLGEAMPAADELNRNEFALNLYRREIRDRVSDKTGFKSFERIGPFRLLPRAFETGEELTQTMKLRRNAVLEKYASEIDAMYGGASSL